MRIDGEHILHESHRHPLREMDTDSVFRCDGCKEIGIGKRYTCAKCNFDLHKHCGIDPHTLLFHPLRPKCKNLNLCLSPPANKTHYCDACAKPVTGFLYRCKRCDFDLHPCCANLPMEIEDDKGVKLRLIERDGKFVYRSKCKKFKLEVAYAREVIAGTSSELMTSSAPRIKSNLVKPSNSRGKMRSYFEMIGLALKIVISALLGDPTSLIVAVIASFMRPSPYLWIIACILSNVVSILTGQLAARVHGLVTSDGMLHRT